MNVWLRNGPVFAAFAAVACSSPVTDQAANDVSTAVGDATPAAPLPGRGTLALAPWPMDFGAIARGSSSVKVLLARNEGSLPVPVWSVVLEGSQAFRPLNPYGAVDGACAEQVGPSSLQVPFVVQPGGAFCLGVVYEPITLGNHEAKLVLWAPPVENAAPLKSGQVLLSGTAVSPGAHLAVLPEDTLDFGLVGKGPTGAIRSVSLHNVGDQPLNVTGLAFGTNTAGGEFALVAPPALPLVLAPDEVAVVELGFSNAGGADGELAQGTLLITSDAAVAPVTVPLRATRATVGRCALELSPPIVDFGAVAYTQTKTVPVTVKNVGTAACSPFSVTVIDAPRAADRAGACEVTVTTGAQSELITVVSEPPAVRDLLQPGQSATIELAFSPADGPLEIGAELRFDALVSVLMLDYLNPDSPSPDSPSPDSPSPKNSEGEPTLWVYAPPAPLGKKAACNVTGVGYVAVDALPAAGQ